MFKEQEVYMYEALEQLYIQKTIFESTGKTLSDSIDGDCIYGEALDAIHYVAPMVDYSYIEDFESVVYKITFEKMPEFYELCKKQARQKGIEFKNHPLVIESEKFMDCQMHCTNTYCISWCTFLPKKVKKKKSYSLLFELSCEFYNYVELVDALYSIRDYFIEEERKLRTQMETPKIIPMKKLQAKQKRRAA